MKCTGLYVLYSARRSTEAELVTRRGTNDRTQSGARTGRPLGPCVDLEACREEPGGYVCVCYGKLLRVPRRRRAGRVADVRGSECAGLEIHPPERRGADRCHKLNADDRAGRRDEVDRVDDLADDRREAQVDTPPVALLRDRDRGEGVCAVVGRRARARVEHHAAVCADPALRDDRREARRDRVLLDVDRQAVRRARDDRDRVGLCSRRRRFIVLQRVGRAPVRCRRSRRRNDRCPDVGPRGPHRRRDVFEVRPRALDVDLAAGEDARDAGALPVERRAAADEVPRVRARPAVRHGSRILEGRFRGARQRGVGVVEEIPAAIFRINSRTRKMLNVNYSIFIFIDRKRPNSCFRYETSGAYHFLYSISTVVWVKEPVPKVPYLFDQA